MNYMMDPESEIVNICRDLYIAKTMILQSGQRGVVEPGGETPAPAGPPPLRVDSRVLQQWLRCAIATNLNSITKRLRFRIASLSNPFAFESLRFAFHFASLPNFESSLSNRFAFESLRFRIARNESYLEAHTPNGSADIYTHIYIRVYLCMYMY